MSNTIYFDLDDVVPEKEVVVKLDGNSHPLKPVTVEQFVANMQTMVKIGSGNMSTETEKNLIVDMLHQVLPTIPVERLNKLTLIQLNALIEFCREHNGEKQTQKEVEQEAGNPQ